MNISADPCDDFYTYVCGKWNNKYFDPNSSTTHWEKLKANIIVVIELALNSTKKSNSKAVQYVIDLYKEYANKNAREKLGVRPLVQFLEQVLGHQQWPLIGNVTIHQPLLSTENRIYEEFEQYWKSNSSFSIKTKLSSFFEHYRFKYFWKFWKFWELSLWEKIKSDEQADVHQWMDCYVEASMVGLHPLVTILSMDKRSLKWQANEIRLLQITENEDIDELYAKFNGFKYMLTHLFNIKHWKTAQDYAMFEVLEFYRSISRLFPNKSKSRTGQPKMKTMTLAELKFNYSSPQFEWTLLLNKYVARTGALFRYTDKDKVRVQMDQLGMFKPFTRLLAKTSIRVLKNAMAMQLIKMPTILDLLDTKHREKFVEESNFVNLSNLRPGVTFVIKYFDVFGPIFVRLYVDYVGREEMLIARDEVIVMMRHLKETFSDSLRHDHTWLDYTIKKNALKKLEAMKIMIAFPEWIFDDAVLDEEFGFSKQTKTKDTDKFIKGQFASSYLNFRRLSVGAEFRKNDKFLQVEREFRFFKYNAAYSFDFNFIGVSQALMSEPYFSVDYPSAINYGNLGYIIAHEMMHAFDNHGRFYDKHGEVANWWTDYANKHFEILSKCFVQQYDGLVDPITGVIIDGKVKLSDNIADNGGLNQAYRAFKNGLNYSQVIAFDEWPYSFQVQFTSEQLFFVSYGINWCSNVQNSSELTEFIQNDTHSPNRFRVNIPLANMVQFAKAFNCPVGSKMNPEHKCSIW